MIKIGIYNEPPGSLGGTEQCVGILSTALSHRYQVDIVHHKLTLTLEQLANHSGTDLSRVHLRYVAPAPNEAGRFHNPWRRYRAAKDWHADLSKPYDLFINFTHGLPPFCHAPRGVLVVLFPFFKPPETSLRDRLIPWRRCKRLYSAWEWKKRMSSYQSKVAISHFTKSWSRLWWKIDCQVIYPPVDTDVDVADKANMVLSVGRFATQGHSKKQREMAMAFEGMKESHACGWTYFCVGGLSESPEDRSYFEDVRRAASQKHTHVLANLERAQLKALYAQSKIFWHAAGYGENSEAHPELAEHFGIATVEAMAAGCVPIVIKKGGQPEIVEHGINGFLWETLDELKEYTTLLTRDDRLRDQMAREAQARACHFSREAYIGRFLSLLDLPAMTA